MWLNGERPKWWTGQFANEVPKDGQIGRSARSRTRQRGAKPFPDLVFRHTRGRQGRREKLEASILPLPNPESIEGLF